jgi:hypothetical protein
LQVLNDFKIIAGDALSPEMNGHIVTISKTMNASFPFEDNMRWNLRFILFNYLRSNGSMIPEISLPVEFRPMWYKNESTWRKLLRIAAVNYQVHLPYYNDLIKSIISEKDSAGIAENV